jgi:hypothetical protein
MCAARGYTLILTMPESMSIERRKMLAFLGAKLDLTPREKGMNGAIARAKELAAEIPGSVIAGQFENPANPEIHRKTTAEEIWYDTAGEVDAIISGVGTGGTLTGLAQALKPRRPGLKMIAVEPTLSPSRASALVSFHPYWIPPRSMRSCRSPRPMPSRPPAVWRRRKAFPPASPPAPRCTPPSSSVPVRTWRASGSWRSSRPSPNATSRRCCSKASAEPTETAGARVIAPAVTRAVNSGHLPRRKQ